MDMLSALAFFCVVGLAYGQFSGNLTNGSDISVTPTVNGRLSQNVSVFSEERPRERRPPGRGPEESEGRRPERPDGRRPNRPDGRIPDGFFASAQQRVARQEPVLVTGADLLAFLAISNAAFFPSNSTPQTAPLGGQGQPPPPPQQGDLRQPPPPPTGGQRLPPPPSTGGQRLPPPPQPQGDQRQQPSSPTGGQRLPPPPPRG